MKQVLAGIIGLSVMKQSYTSFSNSLFPLPKPQNLLQKEDKTVVVIGGGIVGLSTAYFLSQNLLYQEGHKNKVILLEKNKETGKETSCSTGCIFMKNSGAPFTYKPLKQVLEGLISNEQAQVIDFKKAVKEPGLFKFLYYWLQKKDLLQETQKILNLHSLTISVLNDLLNTTGITKESIDYQEDFNTLFFMPFSGQDKEKQISSFLTQQAEMMTYQKEVPILGQDALKSQIWDAFPSISKLQQYNLVTKSPGYTLRTNKFCEQLTDYLTRESKVQILYESELDQFVFDQNQSVTGLKLKGHSDQINCDAVVLCVGPSLARFAKQHFGITCPVIQIKGYTLDIPLADSVYEELNKNKCHFRFKKEAFFATLLPNKTLRIAAFGDVVGFNTEINEQRVNYLKHMVSEIFNTNTFINPAVGLRPTPPDDIPIVGPLKLYPNVYINGGHSARGSQGIATGKIVSDLVAHGQWDFQGQNQEYLNNLSDISHYSPRRFNL